MRIIVSGRHLGLTAALREYAEEKISAAASVLEGHIKNIKITLAGEGQEKSAEVVCTIGQRRTVVAHAEHESMYAAIDLVAAKVARQLRRAKERGRARRTKSRRA